MKPDQVKLVGFFIADASFTLLIHSYSFMFLQGLLLGFSIAAPVGPIGVLCIRRTLSDGRSAGLLSGLGAATADALYGSIAAFGLTALAGFLLDWQVTLRVIGGLFLLYLGARTILRRPREAAATPPGRTLAGHYTSTFFLTLTNPMTILSFAAIFAGLGLVTVTADNSSALRLIAGVFLGSFAWWLTLSTLVGLFRTRISTHMHWINLMAGVIIAGFGFVALLSVFPLLAS